MESFSGGGPNQSQVAFLVRAADPKTHAPMVDVSLAKVGEPRADVYKRWVMEPCATLNAAKLRGAVEKGGGPSKGAIPPGFMKLFQAVRIDMELKKRTKAACLQHKVLEEVRRLPGSGFEDPRPRDPRDLAVRGPERHAPERRNAKILAKGRVVRGERFERSLGQLANDPLKLFLTQSLHGLRPRLGFDPGTIDLEISKQNEPVQLTHGRWTERPPLGDGRPGGRPSADVLVEVRAMRIDNQTEFIGAESGMVSKRIRIGFKKGR